MRAALLLLLPACNLVTGSNDLHVSEAVGQWSGFITDNQNPTVLLDPQGKRCGAPSATCNASDLWVDKLGNPCMPMMAGCVHILRLLVQGKMTLNGDGSGVANFDSSTTLEVGGAQTIRHDTVPGTLTWSTDGTHHTVVFACESSMNCDPRAAQGTFPLVCLNPDSNTLTCVRSDTGDAGSLARETGS